MSTVYEIVTDRILKQLEQGKIPWRCPWGGEAGWPKNGATGRAYRGCNVFILGCQGYINPRWLTFKQAIAAGGNVKKGEKGSPVIYWAKRQWKDKQTEETVEGMVLRYYTVFNVSQCEGLDDEIVAAPAPNCDFHPIERCEQIMDGLPDNRPGLKHGFERAAYNWKLDEIIMPPAGAFVTTEDYYATLFHELAHATGHDSRLARKFGTEHGSPDYAREELVAEMGAAFLCGVAGIDLAPLEQQHAAYIQHWIAKLRGDSRLVVMAAAQAQKAADWCLRKTFEKAEEETAAA